MTIISGFKGKIDYYVNYQACDCSVSGPGIPCARKWPRIPPYARSPRELATQEPFAWAGANWNSLSVEVQDAYRETATGSSLSGRDLFSKSFISDYFREGQWP